MNSMFFHVLQKPPERDNTGIKDVCACSQIHLPTARQRSDSLSNIITIFYNTQTLKVHWFKWIDKLGPVSDKCEVVYKNFSIFAVSTHLNSVSGKFASDTKL